ncbi:unnamed protein product (macronuclear) [Paramecium tetraurelia]|uniref:Uncharacterized protein n=1 Tax=Paramecium tetraurelia TaxID=5888 RepID=A0DT26_PARTE|nr:uncharacterized protein GSPATT00019886001 [Paramecium tetraurelia]CAK86193.1 unnamed protein product [Paramecium tetraurelia]|eukprot:XP_001453590.1 hypothetical protein (macronuclear) [Paramecium tetraurelia strain d4-2]
MGCTSSNQTTDQVIQQVSKPQIRENVKLRIGVNFDVQNSEARMYSIKKNPIVQRRILKSIKPKVSLSKQQTDETYGSFY